MRKAILFGVPHHSNLGDHAIAIAEEQIIKEKFPEYEYKEVAEENTTKCINKVKEYITNDDILFIHGGGNLGNKYILSENGRREIIKSFPNNIIISFPQTMYFEENDEGIKELQKSKEIYNSHENLYFMAREEVSYKSMKEEFTNSTIFFTPDIVTILKMDDTKFQREGVLFIIRNDSEANIDKQFLNTIEQLCKREFQKVEYKDTASSGTIYQHQRQHRLNKMFDNYRKSKVVVTDRLHGMIFAAITGTPCIAIKNYNHKIYSSVKWFEKLPYIKYVSKEDKIEEVEKSIKMFNENTRFTYDNNFSIDIFDEVFRKIKENSIQ